MKLIPSLTGVRKSGKPRKATVTRRGFRSRGCTSNSIGDKERRPTRRRTGSHQRAAVSPRAVGVQPVRRLTPQGGNTRTQTTPRQRRMQRAGGKTRERKACVRKPLPAPEEPVGTQTVRAVSHAQRGHTKPSFDESRALGGTCQLTCLISHTNISGPLPSGPLSTLTLILSAASNWLRRAPRLRREAAHRYGTQD